MCVKIYKYVFGGNPVSDFACIMGGGGFLMYVSGHVSICVGGNACVKVCMYVWGYLWSPAGVRGGWGLPNMGAGN